MPRPPETPADDPLIGRVLGGVYRLESRIGEGAMGVVYRARHTLLEQAFAVKVLHPDLAEDPDLRKNLLKEARAATLFTNEHAVQVRHCAEDDGLLFLAMDLCEGETLEDLLRRTGPLGEGRAARIALQALDALGEAHRVGIVHRDLKPSNVVVERDADGAERVRILDFGLARVVGASRERMVNVLTSIEGAVVGTVAYMSPEQIRALPDVDGRSDLFSLGVTLYEMLSGLLPFRSESLFSVMTRILETDPEPLPELAGTAVSAPMRAVVARALEKDRTRRFQTAKEFADALRGALAGREPPAPPPPPAPAKPAAPRRRAALIAVLAGAASVAVVAAILLANRGDSDAPDVARARSLVAAGRYAEAAPLLERWAEAGEPSGEDWLDLARARLGVGDRDASRALDRSARLLPNDDPRVPLERGRILWRLEGDLPGARAAFNEALTKDRSFQDAREERVRMLLDPRAPKAFEGERLDPVGLAEEDVAFLETQRPDDARGPLLRGVLELRRGDLGKAVAAGEASARLDPDMAEGLMVVGEARGRTGWLARTKGEHAAANEAYRASETALGEAIARAVRKPEHRSQGRLLNEAYLARSHVRLRLDDTEGMLEDERARLALRPAGAETLHAEAEANRQAGRWEDAIRLYELLLEIAPNRDVGFNLAFCHQMLGDGSAAYGDFQPALQRYRRAIDLYTKYRSIAPTDAMFHAYRGECWVRIARLEPASREEALAKAKADFDEGLRLATEAGGGAPAEVLVRRCAWSSAAGDVDGALADIRAAIGDDKSKNPRFYATLALCALGVAAKEIRAGRAEAARPLLEEALASIETVLAQSAPSRPTALKLRALARLMQADLATEAAERAALRTQAAEDATTSATDENAYGLGIDEALLYAAEARLLAKEETPALRAASDARLEGMGSGRWTPAAAYYERLAEALDAAGSPDDAARARRRAAILPR